MTGFGVPCALEGLYVSGVAKTPLQSPVACLLVLGAFTHYLLFYTYPVISNGQRRGNRATQM